MQALLGALKLALKLLQPGVCAKTPSVQLGSQKGSPIAVIVHLSLQLLNLP